MGWHDHDLGVCRLKAGDDEIRLTAFGSVGQNGVLCHLVLEALTFQRVGD